MEKKTQITVEEFNKKFQDLCNEYGYTVVVKPVFTATNHGTFEVSLSMEAVSTVQQ